MSRIPRGLKKRLQESLQNLPPKEAGRLFVIYAHEAAKRDVHITNYAPMVELADAYEDRLQRSRGKPDEAEVVADYNAFAYLKNIFHSANTELGTIAVAIAFDAFRSMTALTFVLLQDAMSETARFVRARFSEGLPLPVSVEDYDRLLAWSKTEALMYPRDAVWRLDLPGDADGDRDRDRVFDELGDKIEAGELVGGPAVWTNDLEAPVLVEEGKIPSWVALRLVWRNYVRAQGLQTYDRLDLKDWSPGYVNRIGHNGDALPDKEIRDVAAAFYRDCRRRPWGKGLAPKPDLDDLVKLLTQAPNPFLHLEPFDFGRVDWEAFAKVEKDDRGEPFEAYDAATVGSMNALDDYRQWGTFDDAGLYREMYYPTEDPARKRDDLARMLAMLDRVETTRQPFTFDRAKEGEYTISELVGVKFTTLFEQKVENLRTVKAAFSGVGEAEKTISDRYFGGLPVLLEDGNARAMLKAADEYLASGEKTVSDWLDRLSKWPWKLDLSRYRVEAVEPDKEVVKEVLDRVIADALSFGHFTREEAAGVERRLGIG